MSTMEQAYHLLAKAARDQIVILGEWVRTSNGSESEIVVYAGRGKYLGRASYTDRTPAEAFYGPEPLQFTVWKHDATEAIEAVGDDICRLSNMRYEGLSYFKLRAKKGGLQCTDYPAVTQVGHFMVMDLLLQLQQELRHLDLSLEEKLVRDTMLERIAAARNDVRDQQIACIRPLPTI